MADMNSPGSEYLKKYLIERSMTKAQKARGETPAQKKRRQQQQADRKKNDPTRKKQVNKMVSKYEKKTNPQSRTDRDLLATAKDHPEGESAQKLKARGLDIKNKKCKKCGSTENVHMDHVDQKTNGKYSPNGRLQWLCNKCHQPKTAENRKEKGQKENQYGRASNESFEAKLHGSLQALLEADKGDKGKRRSRRASRQRSREQEGKRGDQPQTQEGPFGPPGEHGPDARVPIPRSSPAEPRQWRHTPATWKKLRGIEKQREKEQEAGYVWQHGRAIKRASKKRKVGGRTILPKYKELGVPTLHFRRHPQYKELGVPTLHFRRHPQYKDVLQILGGSTNQPVAREVYNELLKRINNIEYHRTYAIEPEALEKYGLKSPLVSGKELGVEEDIVYKFKLKDLDTTLISRSYTTDMVTYSFKDHETNTIHKGQVLRITDDPSSDGKVIIFRDLSGERIDIVTNDKFNGDKYYRYGRPGSDPELVNEYYIRLDNEGNKVKKYVYQRGKSIGLSSEPEDKYGSTAVMNAFNKKLEDLAYKLASDQMQDYFWRNAYQQVVDAWDQSKGELTPEEHARLARKRFWDIVTSDEGKARIKERAQELVTDPEVERRAEKEFDFERSKPELQPTPVPKGAQLREDPRPAAKIFEVTRDSGWYLEGEYDNPADLNKAAYTLYGVEVVSPNPDHNILRYLINGYRPEKDFMSNYSAVIPRLMLDGPPEEVDHSVVLLKVKRSTPAQPEEEEEVDPYQILRIDTQDLKTDEEGNVIIPSQDDKSYFEEIARIRKEYEQEMKNLLEREDNPETRSSIQDALNRALSDTDRQEDEEGNVESDQEYMDRTGIRQLPLDERTLSSYNFYSEKTVNGETVWPALEVSEIRENVRLGQAKEIRYAIPKNVRIYDTYDMQGNLLKGILSTQLGEEYGWLDKVTYSENYDSFGMKKPTSERSGRRQLTSAGMRFRSAMSPAEFALGIINPYLMKLDPHKQVAYMERSFDNAWQNPDRQKIMRDRAIATMVTQRALDMVGDQDAWYSLSDAERTKAMADAREAFDKDLSTNKEDLEGEIRSRAMDTFRAQALTSLNRQMANMQGVCPKCAGQQYLKITIPVEQRGDLRTARTQTDLRAALVSGKAQYEKATAQEYEAAKKDRSKTVIICNACGGTGQQLKEKTSTLYAGSRSRTVDSEVFNAAMDEALNFDEDPEGKPDSALVARTVKALFPSRLTELTKTSLPAAQIKPFLKVLASITDQHLKGKQEIEGALNPRRVTQNGVDYLVYQVKTPEGDQIFAAPVKSDKRYATVLSLVDKFGDMEKVPVPLYIEGKEDPESYILDNIAAVAYGGYGELEKASMPEVMQDYRAQAAEIYSSMSPEAQKAFLQGNPAEKWQFEQLIDGLIEENKPIADETSMRNLMRPWVTKTILQVVSVKQQIALTETTDLAAELKQLDRTEDVEVQRDREFYAIAAEAYRRALLDRDVSKEDFINNEELAHKYISYVMTGDTSTLEENEVQERSKVFLGCKDVSTGEDVVLTYNLDRNPDQRVMIVRAVGKTAKTKQQGAREREEAETQVKAQEDMRRDALKRFEQKNRTPFTQMVEKLGGKWKQANKLFNALANQKFAVANQMLNTIASRTSDPEAAKQRVLDWIEKRDYPESLLTKLRSTTMESVVMPALMIAEEIEGIDSGAAVKSYTPNDIANLID